MSALKERVFRDPAEALTGATAPARALIAAFLLLLPTVTVAEPAAPSNLRLQGAPRAGLFTGVPYPNGMVPATLMPALPTAGNQIQAFPYDPIGMEKPTWTDAANQYWADSTGACDQANNGGRGSPAEPLCELPGIGGGESSTVWTLPAGSQVFVAGNGGIYGKINGNTGNARDVRSVQMPGTADDPIWIIGVTDPVSDPRWLNQPKLGFDRFDIGDSGVMTHVIFDNVHFFSDAFRMSIVGVQSYRLDSLDIGNGGVNYKVGDRLILNGAVSGNDARARANVTAVDGSGTITAIDLFDNGLGFTETEDITIFVNTFLDPDPNPGTGLVLTNFTRTLVESDAEYITFRHSACSATESAIGDGVEAGSSRRCFNLGGVAANPVRFVVIHDTDIFGLGRWNNAQASAPDLHGMQIQNAAYYVWYINNRSFHLQGDSIQCSNSNQWDFNFAERPHYIYVAGNEFYENWENAWDSKGCYHAVISENYIHDFTNEVKGANNTAIIAANDAESYIGANYEWYLNNRIENVGVALGYKGTSEDAFTYFMGNLVTNIVPVTVGTNPESRGPVVDIAARCAKDNVGDNIFTCGDGMVFAQNTIDCDGAGFLLAPQSGLANPGQLDKDGLEIADVEQNQEISLIGNIIYDCADTRTNPTPTTQGWISANENFIITHNYNLEYRTFGATPQLPDAPLIDTKVGNVLGADPEFTDPSSSISGDYTISASSAARGIVTSEASPYDAFRTLYGLDIRRDLTGKVWDDGRVLDAGAYQH